MAYYQGKYKASGSEALGCVDDPQYCVAKWFKLHLHPHSLRVSDDPPAYGSDEGGSGFEIPPLPKSVSIGQIYSDFLRYLMENAQSSFEQSIPSGPAIWRRLRNNLTIALITPNGWDFSQQSVLREAAIRAGLVKEDDSHRLLDFVTEGEASVHYALAYSQSTAWLNVGSTFAVVDAGGSTVDGTLYTCTAMEPKMTSEEACLSECTQVSHEEVVGVYAQSGRSLQTGRVFVDRAAEKMFRQTLKGSKWDEHDCITEMVAAFENKTKRLFDGNLENYQVDFGSNRDNDRSRGIIKVKLSIAGQEVSTAFDEVVPRVIGLCMRLIGGRKVNYILLVGGFGESQYLQKRLRELFEPRGISIVTVEEPAKKAAAEGALIWLFKQAVTARIARYTIGVMVGVDYDPSNPEHNRRRDSVWMAADGVLRIFGGFRPLLRKGTRVPSDFTQISKFARAYQSLSGDLGSHSSVLFVWEGKGTIDWLMDTQGKYLPQVRTLCTLKADISSLRKSLKSDIGPKGEYYKVKFAIAVRFGGTQLQAMLQWNEGVLSSCSPFALQHLT